MLKRLLVALFIFFISLGLFMLPSLMTLYRGIAAGATGSALVIGSVGENIFRIGGLVVSGFLACWLSGKFVGY
jgi:hypothetical protein